MLLLVTKGVPTLERYRHPNLGRLVTPRHYNNLGGMVAAGWPWAADNDAYNGLDEPAFVRMLLALRGVPGCLFVAAPDVVGDAAATLELFDRWSVSIRAHRLPVALVAQNGLEDLEVPWPMVDALFIGGVPDSTGAEWKISPAACRLVKEANRRGLWTHMGRVNTLQRVRYAAGIGCDSADGSGLARFSDRWLRPALTFTSPLPFLLEERTF